MNYLKMTQKKSHTLLCRSHSSIVKFIMAFSVVKMKFIFILVIDRVSAEFFFQVSFHFEKKVTNQILWRRRTKWMGYELRKVNNIQHRASCVCLNFKERKILMNYESLFVFLFNLPREEWREVCNILKNC